MRGGLEQETNNVYFKLGGKRMEFDMCGCSISREKTCGPVNVLYVHHRRC